MCDLAEMMLDAVVAMAISSFCFLGAPLKHDAIVHPHHQHVHTMVTVRRIPICGPSGLARNAVLHPDQPRI